MALAITAKWFPSSNGFERARTTSLRILPDKKERLTNTVDRVCFPNGGPPGVFPIQSHIDFPPRKIPFLFAFSLSNPALLSFSADYRFVVNCQGRSSLFLSKAHNIDAIQKRRANLERSWKRMLDWRRYCHQPNNDALLSVLDPTLNRGILEKNEK